MAGLHLQQLHTACLGLKAALDAALVVNGLDPLTAVIGEPVAATRHVKTPLMVVSFAGDRDRDEENMGPLTWGEAVEVEFHLATEGSESEALAYEGTVADVLRDVKSTLAAAVTAATLRRWTTAGGRSAMSDELVNRDAWECWMYFRAELEW